jgi:hypothetical protein
MARCQSQYPWARLRFEPKCLWVWQDIRPNILGLSYVLSPNTCEFGKKQELILLGSTMHEA